MTTNSSTEPRIEVGRVRINITHKDVDEMCEDNSHVDLMKTRLSSTVYFIDIMMRMTLYPKGPQLSTNEVREQIANLLDTLAMEMAMKNETQHQK